MKKLKVFWSQNPKPGNFGDILTPIILKHYNYDITYCASDNPQAICVGSISKFATANTIVLGSGILAKDTKLNKDAKWIWVRGPLTRKCVIQNGGKCPKIYGDPALLLPRIYRPNICKQYKIGIIPHYVDYKEVKQQYPDHFVINLLDDNPLNVIDQLLQCDKIISSSLHGIIVANAYGIPAAYVKFSDKLSGDGIKFEDYFRSINVETILSTIDKPKYITATYDDSIIDAILKQGEFI